MLKKCTICIIIKKSRRTNEKNSIAIETSRQFWQTIIIDFVIRLSLSIQTSINIIYDIIMTVIDKFIKNIELILIRKNISAKTLTHILINEIIKNHEISEVIISDRDKLFIFKFWKALIKRLEIKRKISTAFHFRTNEQSKRINQTMKQYIRTYVSIEQSDWADLLFTAQFAFNNYASVTIEKLSFLLNHIRHSVLSNDYENNKNSVFTEFVKDIVRIRNRIMKKLKKREKVINNNESSYDLNVKDKIYVKTTNLDLKEESKKLVKTVKESFKITRNIKR